MESTGGEERLVDATQHVDEKVFVQLTLTPYHRSVEQPIAVTVKAAFHRHRLANVNHVELTV